MSATTPDTPQPEPGAAASAPASPNGIAPDIDHLFERQQAAAMALRGSSARQRIDRIKRLKQALFDRRKDIQRACYRDFKKHAAEVEATEILPIVVEANDAIRHTRKWMKPKRVLPTRLMLGTSGAVRYEPRGVCLIIAPWNYPLNLALGPLVSALAAGNTAIIKPSEMTPHCAALMQDMVETLFEPGEVAVVQGEVETTQRLLDKPFNHIFFTGSPAVGKIVMGAAAKHLASVTLELGGKSPVVVDASANVDKAAESIAWAKFANNGQTCTAPDYVYVHEDISQAFAEATRRAIAKFYGDTDDIAANDDYCRMVNRKHYDRVTGIIDDARNRGGEITVAGGENDPQDNFIAPTIIHEPAADARVMQEEIFGPVMPVLTYRDVDAVIAAINAKPKPLALYVYATDNDVIERVIGRTSAGGTCINTALMHFLHANLPFGGVNNSGIGNAHGHWGFKAFSHERAVLRDRFALGFLFWPPYNRFTRAFMRMATRFMS